MRPTSAAVVPADIERYLDADQFKLYTLIWKRAVACQMAHAVFDTVAVDMLAGADGPGRHLLRANGSTLIKPGYIAVYQEGRDDAVDDDSDHMLPAMQVGEPVRLVALHPEQHFTEPPPRYTEASLVKSLEEHGIGRPSTYASIISTLRDREYVEIENRRFTATDIGQHRQALPHRAFPPLRRIRLHRRDGGRARRGGARRGSPGPRRCRNSGSRSSSQVESIEKTVSREQVAQARELGTDPASGKPVTVRMGRFGPFVQIGTKDDADKPRFAGLRPGQKMDTISSTTRRAVQVAAHARQTAEGEPVIAGDRPLRPVRQVRCEVRLPQGRRPVHGHAGARAGADSGQADCRRQSHHPGFRRREIQVLNGRYGPYVTDETRTHACPRTATPRPSRWRNAWRCWPPRPPRAAAAVSAAGSRPRPRRQRPLRQTPARRRPRAQRPRKPRCQPRPRPKQRPRW